MKSQILKLLRSTGLAPIADRLRFQWQRGKNASANQKFMQDNPSIIFPPEYMMYESFQLNYEKYYLGGRHTSEWLLNLCRPHLDLQEASVLDWGCGPARIVRHLPDLLPQAKIYGTDYNTKTIDWCQKSIPKVQFSIGNIKPPLTYTSNHFDLIYAISIFTHLSEENHAAWLLELTRILKPGGILFLTTQGDVFRQKLTNAESARYAEGELVVRGGVKEGHRVYSAFQPPDYFRGLIEGSLDELQHIPGTVKEWGLEQDVFILRKGDFV